MYVLSSFFFFQAEDGIRDLVRSRGLGDVYKRQLQYFVLPAGPNTIAWKYTKNSGGSSGEDCAWVDTCLLYTSDAADDLLCVDLGGRRIIKKKKEYNENVVTEMLADQKLHLHSDCDTMHNIIYQ